MIAATHKPDFPIRITKDGVKSPFGVFGFDVEKTSEEHINDFCKLGGAIIHEQDDGIALECGVKSGLVVIEIGKNRGGFVPDFDPGEYGVQHTNLGNLIAITKRIVDVANCQVHMILGIVPDQWVEGLNSSVLVQPDLQGHGAINLLADGSTQLIEPSPCMRFYTPFYHIPGAGSAFLDENRDPHPGVSVYPLYRLGIMTLDRTQLSELLRAFNADWTNGAVFARKNKIGEIPTDIIPKEKARRRSKKKNKEDLDQWS